jgi:hypothetical protein
MSHARSRVFVMMRSRVFRRQGPFLTAAVLLGDESRKELPSSERGQHAFIKKF